jgi:hypothetical protein
MHGVPIGIADVRAFSQWARRFDRYDTRFYRFRIESVPDPEIEDPTAALLRITHACVCGSDLWFYRVMSRIGNLVFAPATKHRSRPSSHRIARLPGQRKQRALIRCLLECHTPA